MKKGTPMLGLCPSCNQTSSVKEWNEFTAKHFDEGIQELDEDLVGEYLYDCPKCEHEVSSLKIKLSTSSFYPVAVTLSYTAYIDAESAEHALRIAESMSGEELTAHIGENPTIEIEASND